ncbi:hypothetical protein GCM10027174_01650 [Salinifilum aidingensis]
MLTEIAVIILVVLVLGLATSIKVIRQYERGVVFRFGRLLEHTRSPGLTMIVPAIDRMHKVSLQIVTMPIPAQEGITRDNVTVRVDAVVYFRVEDPPRAIINVEDYQFAMGQVAQTSLRSIIGKSDLDDLLSNREKLNQGLELMIDNPALGWGVHIDRVEIKDVSLPDTMKRSIARQAEAERERRSRIISADGEYQASRKLSDAANVMSDTPAALQLRLLETVVEVAAERNSTLVLPFPVELLRFVDQTAGMATGAGEQSAESTTSAASTPADTKNTEPEEPGTPSTAALAALADPEIPAAEVPPAPRSSEEDSPAEASAAEAAPAAEAAEEVAPEGAEEGTTGASGYSDRPGAADAADSARASADEDGRAAAHNGLPGQRGTEEREFSGYSGLS